MDPVGLSDDSDLMDGPSEESPSEESLSEDSSTDGSDWLIRRFRLDGWSVRRNSVRRNSVRRYSDRWLRLVGTMLPSGVTRRPPCFLPDESDWMSGTPSLLCERGVIGPYVLVVLGERD